MSEQFGKLNPVDRVLKQSLLNLKDQMSVYSTQPWTAENGHGYNEAEQFAMREGPMMVGRGPNTRQPNPMERRRNTEHEIDLHSLTNVQCRFENPRYVLYCSLQVDVASYSTASVGTSSGSIKSSTFLRFY